MACCGLRAKSPPVQERMSCVKDASQIRWLHFLMAIVAHPKVGTF